MYRVRLVFLTLALFFSVIYGYPTFLETEKCYSVICPDNTYACEKTSKVSNDKNRLIIEIHCLGKKGIVLKNVTKYEPNPFDLLTDFQSYSYTAFQSTIIRDRDTNDRSDKNDRFDTNTNTKDVEEVDDSNIYKPSGKSIHHQASEIDDLNGGDDPNVV